MRERRMMLGLALAVGLLLWPEPARGDGERLLVDLTVEAPSDGHCFVTEPGTITATVRMVDPPTGQRPIGFTMGPAPTMQFEGSPRVDAALTTMPATYRTRATYRPATEGDVFFCYWLTNPGRTTPGELGWEAAPLVALKLTWSPPAP